MNASHSHDPGDGWNPSPEHVPSVSRFYRWNCHMQRHDATGTQSRPKLCESDMMAEGIEQTFKL